MRPDINPSNSRSLSQEGLAELLVPTDELEQMQVNQILVSPSTRSCSLAPSAWASKSCYCKQAGLRIRPFLTYRPSWLLLLTPLTGPDSPHLILHTWLWQRLSPSRTSVSLPLLEKWGEWPPDPMGWGMEGHSPWVLMKWLTGGKLSHWCLAGVWSVLPKLKKLLF